MMWALGISQWDVGSSVWIRVFVHKFMNIPFLYSKGSHNEHQVLIDVCTSDKASTLRVYM